jgi:hypothetical protein
MPARAQGAPEPPAGKERKATKASDGKRAQ